MAAGPYYVAGDGVKCLEAGGPGLGALRSRVFLDKVGAGTRARPFC